MSNEFGPNYGSITQADADVLEACLLALLPKNPITVLEIGCFRGQTGWGIKRFLQARGIQTVYWGIDAGLITKPGGFPGAKILLGKSEDMVKEVPDNWDLIFIDGCHCSRHVRIDTENYAPKVRDSGFLLYHDCHPAVQDTDPQPCGGPIAVVDTLYKMGWPWPPWRFFLEKFDPAIVLGGMRAYRKGP